ncbi:hypothetical protein CDV31_006722 [Fusarium ambrosium]|uniref:Uncharacterized protein n=1 Tax=Fusarium ambrosium TaxID=131363 RepID=A0A428UB24_9HYPO|nr:hypothetical protein CDV31_006722 [Fusarium ambrosium]
MKDQLLICLEIGMKVRARSICCARRVGESVLVFSSRSVRYIQIGERDGWQLIQGSGILTRMTSNLGREAGSCGPSEAVERERRRMMEGSRDE